MPNQTLLTSAEGMGGILPEEYGDLIVLPVQKNSVAYQVATLVNTSSNELHVPLIVSDTAAEWVAEGQEINPSEGVFGEIVSTPRKIAALTKISRELADDSSPEASALVGEGIARDIQHKIDATFFGATPANGPQGLESLDGVTIVDAGAAWTDLDPFIDAQSNAEQLGTTINSWVANPEDAKVLYKLRDEEGSNRPLLANRANDQADRYIQGALLFVSPAVTPGTVWGIPRDRVLVVTRKGTEVSVNDSVYFTSDRVAVRGVMRVSFAYPQPKAIQKLMLTSTPAG